MELTEAVADIRDMEEFRGRLAIFGVALVAMTYVVVYQTHLVLMAVSKLHR